MECFLLATAVLMCVHPVYAAYPPRPYYAIWNSPTAHCFDGLLDLSKFNIMQNENSSLNGGNVTLFTNIGEFPLWGTVNNITLNGGIPQLGNLSLHLETVQSDINSLMPDPNFTGLAVIDFHAWKPLYQQNIGKKLDIYQTQSRAYTQKRFPNLNGTQLEAQAKIDFDAAARMFLEGTLQLASKMRPGGLWGYMGYPYCYEELQYFCNATAVQANEEIRWLFNASTALYPSSFYTVQKRSQSDSINHLVGLINESRRIIASTITPLHLYLYTRYSYDNQVFYNKTDVSLSTYFASTLGVDGVVIYDTSVHTIYCDGLVQFINATFGPTNKMAHDWAFNCSKSICSMHGQCVDTSRAGSEINMRHLASPGAPLQQYRCQCYRGWTGLSCQAPTAQRITAKHLTTSDIVPHT